MSGFIELCFPITENKSKDDVKTDIISDKTICLDTEETAETPLVNENSCPEDGQQLIHDDGNNDVVHDANTDKSDKLKQLLENEFYMLLRQAEANNEIVKDTELLKDSSWVLVRECW